MKLFYNAKCFDSAHVIKEWPWGFRMKTEARFWIETTKHGDRFVKQTLNPKNGKWCKPKKSTYESVMVLTQDDDNKMSRISIGKYDSQNWMAEALEIIDFNKLSDDQKKQICTINAWQDVMKNVTFQIRSSDDHRPEAEIDAEQDIITQKITNVANAKANECMAKNNLV